MASEPEGMTGKWQGEDVAMADSELGEDSKLGKPAAARVAQASNFPADAQFENHSKFLHEMMPE